MARRHPGSTLFPYTTLFRSRRRLVGAGDGHGHGLDGGAAVTVMVGGALVWAPRLPGCRVIGGVVGNLEAPADGAAIAGVDLGLIEREGAEVAARLRRKGRGVGVGRVDIRIGDRAACV